jgi:hypothetical protein
MITEQVNGALKRLDSRAELWTECGYFEENADTRAHVRTHTHTHTHTHIHI